MNLLALLLLSVTAAASFLLAWPLVARLKLSPAERLVATVALSPLLVYLVAWTRYVAALPAVSLSLIPILGGVVLVSGWRTLRETCRDPIARELLISQVIVTSSCLCWLASIASYSGGGWAADWFEHWERTRFFIEHWPTDQLLLGAYTLPARPPLANIVIGALVYPSGLDFARYQIATTLFGSLAFLPAALLAHRFAPHVRVIAVMTAIVLANPLFVQNATFAWTKLPAAVFILAGLVFFLRTRDADAPPSALPLTGVCLAAGILAHYSAGPYALMLGLLWFLHRRGRLPAALALSAAILATWFAWSLAVYGLGPTLGATSSVKGADPSAAQQTWRVLANFRDTLVPHFLRAPDPALIAQKNPWGLLRDHFFQSYQLNLLLAFGSVAWLGLLCALFSARPATDRATRLFWSAFVVGVIVLGIATHGSRDEWGLAHICLQSLVLVGLAFLAGRWPSLSRPWRLGLIVGGVIDFIFGIALHFAVQNFAMERWSGPSTLADWVSRQSSSAVMNLSSKMEHHLAFVGDALPLPIGAWPFAALALLVFALRRALPRTS